MNPRVPVAENDLERVVALLARVFPEHSIGRAFSAAAVPAVLVI